MCLGSGVGTKSLELMITILAKPLLFFLDQQYIFFMPPLFNIFSCVI